MKRLSLLLTGVAAMALLTQPAHGQTVNYGALEAMFGEPVTTSATGKPQRASEVPATMQIITAEDIRRSGGVDIPTILGRLAGFSVLQWGPTSYDLSIRGYDQPQSPRILVLVNGRQVYLDHYGYTAWSTLPITIAEIRQIEVVKGTNTALFGFNAAAGVINIITYNPLYDVTNGEYAVTGSQERYEIGGVRTFQSKDKKFGLRVSAHGFESSDFGAALDVINRVGLDPYKRAVNADMLYQLTPNSQVGIEGSMVRESEQSPINYSRIGNYLYNEGSAKLSYMLESSMGLIQAQTYINSNDTKVSLPGSPGVFKEDNAVWVTQLSDLVKISPNHTLRFSLEHRFNRMNVSNATGPDWGTIHYNVLSPGLMWDWAINNSLSWTNAVRFDRLELGRKGTFPTNFPQDDSDWDHSINSFSYNSGLVWRATEDDTFRLMTGRGIQAPSMTGLGAFINDLSGLGIGVVTGNPHLQPSVTTNYELTYDRDIDELKGKGSVRIFHQIIQDVMLGLSEPLVYDIAPGPGPGVRYFINGGRSIMDGFELELDGKFGEGWHWGANYTFIAINDHYTSSADDRAGVTEGHTPPHTVNLNLGWSGEKWEADGYLRYQSSHLSYEEDPLIANMTRSGRIDGFATVAARVGYKLSDKVTVSLSGQQLNASSITTSGAGRDSERRVYLTLTGAF